VTILSRPQQFMINGFGAIAVEVTTVVSEGRMSHTDTSVWPDSYIKSFKRIVEFIHVQGGQINVQLTHTDRKSSTRAPFFSAPILPGETHSDRNVATKEEVDESDDDDEINVF
jgi:2,4-dienoyl-CoA reductase-like NADH-dependent reductase (Old Yellow Enzyme family)